VAEVSYQVKVTKEGDQWLADVVNLPGAHTFAGSLTALAENVDEVIRLVDDSVDDGDELDIQWDYSAVEQIVASAAHVGVERSHLLEQVRLMELTSVFVVFRLSEEGYSNRDISHLLGITPGRVSQIRNTAQRPSLDGNIVLETALEDVGRVLGQPVHDEVKTVDALSEEIGSSRLWLGPKGSIGL
jgi:predicted RNase H-like HicB family nuclease